MADISLNQTVRVDATRLWDRLATVSRFGMTPANGLDRLSLSNADRDARAWLLDQAATAGYHSGVDAIGNIFITRPGRNPELAPVLVGSHLDSQPKGGRFDGTYGVLAGMEVLAVLDDAGVQTQRSVVVANWTNEEGSRFSPSMLGSAVYSRQYPLEEALQRLDHDGVSLGEALRDAGYAGNDNQAPSRPHRSFELHIEQGPVLEQERIDIGVVTGVYGIRWYDVIFDGMSGHSGTTPMGRRNDALVAAAEVIAAVRAAAVREIPEVRATAGRIDVTPNSRNVIPGRTVVQLDIRHADSEVLDRVETQLHSLVREVSQTHGVRYRIDRPLGVDPTRFDPRAVDTVRQAAQAGGLSWVDIVSGAGHDSVHVSRVSPTAMIFVPCKDGISHNEAEDITEQWAANGATVLLHAVLAAAQEDDAP
ncbi:MAG: M20 family metallo-hydrolase [Mycobacterium sp.]